MAYGQIYNTTWWGNALDTARTAGTEPDFFGSQMKLLTSEQDNLVTNGDFATDSDWIAPDSGVTFLTGSVLIPSTSSNRIFQPNVTSAAKNYKVEYTISANIGTTALKYFNGTGYVFIEDSVGTHTFQYTRLGANNGWYFSASEGTSITIDNVSVQLVRLDLDQIEAKKCLADWIHVTALQDLNN